MTGGMCSHQTDEYILSGPNCFLTGGTLLPVMDSGLNWQIRNLVSVVDTNSGRGAARPVGQFARYLDSS